MVGEVRGYNKVKAEVSFFEVSLFERSLTVKENAQC